MDANSSGERIASTPTVQRPTRWLCVVIESAASIMALYAMGALLINKTDTKVAFFGETPEVTPENVSTYHRWLVALAVAIAFSFGATLSRRTHTARSRYWHGLVLVAGLLSAAAFHVALDAPTPEPVPIHDRSGTVCHSGSDNYCVGG